MKHFLLGLIIIMLTACASEEGSSPDITGSWRYTYPATGCVENYNFDASGTFTADSLDEVFAGNWSLGSPVNGKYPFTLLFTYDNQQPDCSGLNTDSTGDSLTLYITATTDTLRFYLYSNDITPVGTFTRL